MCPNLLVVQKLTSSLAWDPRRKLKNNLYRKQKSKMVAVEHETTTQITVWYNVMLAIRRRWCRYEDVAEKQILAALLWETRLAPQSGYVYRVLQGGANEARGKRLLNNPLGDDLWSRMVGNADRMKPSADGWEQTQGMLSRHLAQGAEKLFLILLSRTPLGTREDLDKFLQKPVDSRLFNLEKAIQL